MVWSVLVPHKPRELSIDCELIALFMIPQPFVGVCYQQQPSRDRVTGLRSHSYSWCGSVTSGFEIKRCQLLGHMVGSPIRVRVMV